MPQKQAMVQEAVDYFFTNSKDVHEDDHSPAITLFGRLSRETAYSDGVNTYSKIDTFWVDIDDIKLEEATEKIKAIPNRICRYAITEEVFRNLYQLSRSNPKELYFITPLHITKE